MKRKNEENIKPVPNAAGVDFSDVFRNFLPRTSKNVAKYFEELGQELRRFLRS
jgi:hypothetical protein